MPAFGVLVWYLLAGAAVTFALLVIHVRDIFKAALFLVATFLSVVGFFVLLRAEFLAVVQLLIYVGAISVLIIFAVMLTRDVHSGNPFTRLRLPALLVACLLLAAIVFAVVGTAWVKLPGLAESAPVLAVLNNTTGELGSLLVGDYVLTVWISAVLLVTAIVGAIVVVRER